MPHLLAMLIQTVGDPLIEYFDIIFLRIFLGIGFPHLLTYGILGNDYSNSDDYEIPCLLLLLFGQHKSRHQPLQWSLPGVPDLYRSHNSDNKIMWSLMCSLSTDELILGFKGETFKRKRLVVKFDESFVKFVQIFRCNILHIWHVPSIEDIFFMLSLSLIFCSYSMVATSAFFWASANKWIIIYKVVSSILTNQSPLPLSLCLFLNNLLLLYSYQ